MDAFIGEIKPFAFTYPPYGWMQCAGQELLIAQYAALYAVIGIYYGGDGKTYFNLPNLTLGTAGGTAIVGVGQGQGLSPYTIAETGGASSVALTISSIPSHNHTVTGATGNPTTRVATPANNLLGRFAYTSPSHTPPLIATEGYVAQTPATSLNPASLLPAGTGTNPAHENRQPYLPVSFYICVTEGEFPVRN